MRSAFTVRSGLPRRTSANAAGAFTGSADSAYSKKLIVQFTGAKNLE